MDVCPSTRIKGGDSSLVGIDRENIRTSALLVSVGMVELWGIFAAFATGLNASGSKRSTGPKASEVTLNQFGELFNEEVIIVVGKRATEVEYQSALALASRLEEMTLEKPVLKKDSELQKDDRQTHDLILIGSKETNRMFEETAELADAPVATGEYPGRNGAVLEILLNPWNRKKALLTVEGSTDLGIKVALGRLILQFETLKQSRVIVEWLQEGATMARKVNYIHEWESGKQDVVPDGVYLAVSYTYNPETGQLFFVVQVNDDDYNKGDYLGIVFDSDGNGVIESADNPYGLWANNMTAPAILGKSPGHLAFAEVRPRPGFHRCAFDSATGYIVTIPFDAKRLYSAGRPTLMRISFVDQDVSDWNKNMIMVDAVLPHRRVRKE